MPTFDGVQEGPAGGTGIPVPMVQPTSPDPNGGSFAYPPSGWWGNPNPVEFSGPRSLNPQPAYLIDWQQGTRLNVAMYRIDSQFRQASKPTLTIRGTIRCPGYTGAIATPFAMPTATPVPPPPTATGNAGID